MDNPHKLPIEYLYKCPKCGVSFHGRLHRGWFVRTFFPNRPFGRFFCGKCLKAYYVRLDKK
jgi:ribosomal protein L34E